jgi:hypothetical protein
MMTPSLWETCDDMRAELRKLDVETNVALADFFPSILDLGIGCSIESRIVAIF